MAVNVPVQSAALSLYPGSTGGFGGYGAGFGGDFSSPFTGYGAGVGGALSPFSTGFGGGYGAGFGGAPTPYGGNLGGYLGTGFGGALTPFGGLGGALTPFGGLGGAERYFKNLERNFSSELNLFSSRPSSYLEQYSFTNPIRVDAEGNRSLNLYFDLKSYKPEEVNVTLNSKDRFISVEASHEVKDKEHYVKRQYSRKVYIPEDIKIDLSKIELKSHLTNEGLLGVEATLPKLSLEEARSGSKYLTAQPTNVYNIATKTI